MRQVAVVDLQGLKLVFSSSDEVLHVILKAWK